ncbi:bifunctional pyr operon transcriptional regulator/uracil phosphoribosyltransferase PyrR [Candidatus Uabimicrobium sp. HlEnr_7]|uniref:bifunctional pyr operon transcriptional regulator/uracil phosphoribosyltransferase PyrR n=1 Tax=Candidatus Uabimicrobium helgolandensis TaxID=3095367 RepID=UPI0035580242
MNDVEINQVLNRLAAEIIEQSQQDIILVGIHRRGVPLAARLLQKIQNLGGTSTQMATIDISFYQDDLTQVAEQPIFKEFQGPEFSNKDIVLIDDVIYSGRTVLTAINEIMNKGLPNKIRLAVLVDRGHHRFPIQADYAGKLVPTRKSEHIKVMLKEIDGEDKVLIMEVENDE